MEDEKEHKLSKNKRRKALRYGKAHIQLSDPSNRKQHIASSSLREFIQSLLKPRIEEDHSLDELEFKKRPRWILPGCFEMGKRR